MTEANVDRHSGLSQIYDEWRPRPPTILRTALLSKLRLPQGKKPTVLDLGCGTGRSTVFWEQEAERVIGLEPNSEMFKFCTENYKDKKTLAFVQSKSHDSKLPEESVDLITCSQSFHWMDVENTLKEAHRLLRPGGIFAAYDYDWPMSVKDWKVEQAWRDFDAKVVVEGNKLDLFKGVVKRDKFSYISTMRQLGLFSYVNEIVLHSVERRNAESFLNMTLSQGSVGTVQRGGISLDDCGFKEFKKIVEDGLGDELSDCILCYRVRYCVK
eukprot:TRINITY_DN6260_c0_g1_i4.p1 TRINITY_DN6260_c0_g1~~TRINITY_DN6260_c0_g1_i4.p1  ORF type:complete len:284 (-),score=44.73 TRINITY_DN6260_c0_g1_i4:59-865(-)